jgi:hypothetical protein
VMGDVAILEFSAEPTKRCGKCGQAAVAMRVAAAKQQTIDGQRALIEELTAERDAWTQTARDGLLTMAKISADRDAWRDKAQRDAEPFLAALQADVPICPVCNAATYSVWHVNHCAAYQTFVATPASDPITPGKSDQESATAVSAEKPNTGHPAGGRASTCVHHAEWPASPASALTRGDGIPR